MWLNPYLCYNGERKITELQMEITGGTIFTYTATQRRFNFFFYGKTNKDDWSETSCWCWLLGEVQ